MIAQSVRAKHAQQVQAVMDLLRGDAVVGRKVRHADIGTRYQLILLRHEFSVPARCAVSRGKSMTTRTSGQIFNER